MNGHSSLLQQPASASSRLKLAILGVAEGTHIGGSLARAAKNLDLDAIWFDAEEAWRAPRFLRSFFWHFAGGRRPAHLRRYADKLVALCAAAKPDVVVTTGMAPLTERALQGLTRLGIVSINYSTDDPWNPVMRSRWYLKALPGYDFVFTTRRSNIDDFRRHGCKAVHWLPFGYDENLFYGGPDDRSDVASPDILFVGGADSDRVQFIGEFMHQGPPVTVAGGYWDRHQDFKPLALGLISPDKIRALTAAAKVNLCLVRRANRDGHVMRSFEIAAVGGCMLAEDTAEHREIFGPDGDAVVYFRNPREAAERAKALLYDLPERKRLARRLHDRIVGGRNTYTHRLAAMLKVAVGQSSNTTQSQRRAVVTP